MGNESSRMAKELLTRMIPNYPLRARDLLEYIVPAARDVQGENVSLRGLEHIVLQNK